MTGVFDFAKSFDQTKMKKLFCFICLVYFFGTLAGTSPLFGQVSVTGQVFAEVVDMIDARENSQLNFGQFSPGVLGGEITISPQGEIYTNGTVVIGGGMRNPASFYVTGGDKVTFSISIPEEPVIIKHVGKEKQMTVERWTSFPLAGSKTGFLEDGGQLVSVGATLLVGIMNDNPPGIYSGTYTITFGYN